ncbi:hypothetical protein MPSEU_000148500 [Mayamaea pseudoterrestris]|nr:hypothetical protein MPSEU_000148500 [Mayamaea pseudoterrestris]
MSAKPSSHCDHGYDTRLPDGSDPYKEAMNELVRVCCTPIDAKNNKRTVTLYRPFYCDPIFLRKIVAAALMQLEKNMKITPYLASLAVQIMLAESMVEETVIDGATISNVCACEANALLFFLDRASCSCFAQQKEATLALPETECCVFKGCAKIIERYKMLMCANCKASAYCSKECQANDWKDGHKRMCQIYALQFYILT